MNRPPVGAPWQVAALTFAWIAFGLWIGAGYDTGRDVAAAWSIVHDGTWPTAGPVFAGQVRLGPAWFYVLALPMALWPGWLAPALLTVGLTSLQIPLAYATGTRLADRHLGLVWAYALVIPGWAAFELVGFSCTNLARMLVLATLYCLVRTQQTPAARWWFGAGLASALAVHAHPSVAWLVIVVLAFSLLRPQMSSRVVRDRVAALSLALAGCALPFLPAVASLHELAATGTSAAAANVGIDNLARLPALARSMVGGGPYTLFATLDGGADVTGRIAAALAMVLVAVGAIAGIFGALRAQRVAFIAFVLTLFSVLFVALVRPVTPLYMVYSVSACLALLVAAGWRLIERVVAGIPGGIVNALFALAAAATFFAAGWGQIGAMERGGGYVDSPRLANITAARADPQPLPDVWLPAKEVDALGAALCAAPGSVYGALPYLLDVHYALPIRMHCPQAIATFDRRGAPSTGRIALAAARWSQLGALPPQRVGSLGLAPIASVIAAPAVRALPRSDAYPPHAYATGLPMGVDYAFTLPAGQVVVASNPRVAWMPQWETSARCNGAPATLVTEDRVTRVYACAALAQPAQWNVSARAQDPGAVEFVAFDPGPPARR